MRVLLTESASASAREVVTVLARQGHRVGVVEPKRDGLLTVSRRVKWRHKVPLFGAEPLAYLDALSEAVAARQYDVLLPIHEQLAVLSRYPGAIDVPFAVPPFSSLARVQDKAAAVELLRLLGIPLPVTSLVSSVAELRSAASFPCYVKLPISTGSRGVWHVDGPASFAEISVRTEVADTFARGWQVLVQEPVDGRFVMAQTVFDHGVLVAAHVVERVREGVQGSASAKESVSMPGLVSDLEKLGAELSWHGALSVDAIVDSVGTAHLIDLNPRLVEPVNASLAGVDLVGALLDVSLGRSPAPLSAGRVGVRTTMALMAVLRHGELGHNRRAVAAELLSALFRRGVYRESPEELLPVPFDPPAIMPLLAVGSTLLVDPAKWRSFSKPATGPTTVLSPAAWASLTDQH
ncbi:MAG: hypothetical protein GEV28_12575 [Actinophytocola sp.]|uniref:hypothetical protein n=1 Tax=Actinophytocola sp. TaxID=1872138 RepID=UPI00132A2D34|nr:hypothetical protein [Actinophytocola sp.]MPZ81174.1 hypothetical protein [Actinophytocola sp.]